MRQTMGALFPSTTQTPDLIFQRTKIGLKSWIRIEEHVHRSLVRVSITNPYYNQGSSPARSE